MEKKHWREKKQRKRPIYISQKEKYKLKHKNNPKKRRIWPKEKQTKETETKHTKKRNKTKKVKGKKRENTLLSPRNSPLDSSPFGPRNWAVGCHIYT
jgi:hypothetical protein